MQPWLSRPATTGSVGEARRWLAVLGGIPFLAVAVAYAYYIAFSRVMGDDEGYLMLSVKTFLEGQPLYDGMFTQYGPVYYFYQWCLRALAGVPLTHDVTRVLCVIHWLAAASILGIAGGKLTRSALLGVFVFMQAVVHLSALANEPGHPQELVAILLALAALAVTVESRGLAPLGILVLLGVALAFIKVNVGLFYGIALVLAVRGHAEDRFARGVWPGALVALSVMAPFVLMRRHLTEPWCRNYSVIAAVTLVTVLLLARHAAARLPLARGTYARLAAFLLLPGALVVGLVWLNGTSLRGMVDGLLLTPLKLPAVGLLRKPISNWTLVNTAISLLGATLLLVGYPGGGRMSCGLALKAAYGVVGAFLLARKPELQFDWLLPWLWLVLLPDAPWSPTLMNRTFPRIFLCLMAAWQTLQAYPVAGTQVTLATLLLVLSYTLCLADVFRWWRRTAHGAALVGALTPRTAAALSALVWVGLLALFANAWCQPHVRRRAYATLVPFGLPGTQRLRVARESAELYQALMHYLAANYDTFITYPGLNSFYFWTGKRPPTPWNATGWGPLTVRQREEILAALRAAPRACIILHDNILRTWMRGAPQELEPLIRCLREECREVQRFGPFIIFALERSRRPDESNTAR